MVSYCFLSFNVNFHPKLPISPLLRRNDRLEVRQLSLGHAAEFSSKILARLQVGAAKAWLVEEIQNG